MTEKSHYSRPFLHDKKSKIGGTRKRPTYSYLLDLIAWTDYNGTKKAIKRPKMRKCAARYFHVPPSLVLREGAYPVAVDNRSCCVNDSEVNMSLQKRWMSVLLLPILLLNLTACGLSNKDNELLEDFKKIEQNIQWIADFPENATFVGSSGKFVAFQQEDDLYLYDKSANDRLPLGKYDAVFFNHFTLTGMTQDNITNFSINGEIISNTLFAKKYPDEYIVELTPQKAVNGLFGYVNLQGIWMIEPQYSYAEPFSEGYAYVEKSNGKTCGFINMDQQFQVLCIEDGVARENMFHDGRLLVRTYGNIENEVISTYITSENELLPNSLLPDQMLRANYPYQNARNFSEGMAAVQIQGQWGYINHEGALQIHPQYKNASSYSNGIAAVERNDNKVGFIDKEGNEIGTFQSIEPYYFTGECHDGLYQVRAGDGKYNLVNQDGEYVLNQDYTYVNWSEPFWNIAQDVLSQSVYLKEVGALIPAFKTQEYAQGIYILDSPSTQVYDRNKKQVYSLGETKGACSEGLIVSKWENNLYGYVNLEGEWIIPPVFMTAEKFSNGTAFVATKDRAGFISNPLRYHGAWERDEVVRGQAFDIFHSEALLDTTITYEQFFDMVYSGYKKLLDMYKHGQTSCAADSAITADQMYSAMGFPVYDENATVTRGEAFYALRSFAKQMGQQVDYFYYPYGNSDGMDAQVKCSISYLSALGVIDNLAPKEIQEKMTHREATMLLTLLLEAISG